MIKLKVNKYINENKNTNLQFINSHTYNVAINFKDNNNFER